MLTLNGIQIGVPAADLEEWVERRICWRDFFYWERTYWPTAGLSFVTYPGVLPERPFYLNRLYWPQGASRWASFLTIVSDAQLAGIKAQGGSLWQQNCVLALTWQDSAAGSATVGPGVTAPMLALPPLPLSIFGGVNGFYLLVLVDDRFRWWTVDDSGRGSTPASSWAALYAGIVNALGITFDSDPIPAAYLTPSPQLSTLHQFLPILLDAVAYNVGQRIVRDPSGAVHGRNFANSLLTISNNLALPRARLVAGGKINDADARGAIPQTYVLAYATPGGQSVTTAAATGGTAPGQKVITTSAVYDGSNPAQMLALAQQAASDYGAQFVGGGTWEFAGTIPWVPEGIDEAVEWIYTKREGIRQQVTRIYPPAWNDLTTQLYHQAVAANGQPINQCPEWVQLTSRQGGSYGWQEVIPGPQGSWLPGGTTGSPSLFPAFNSYGNNCLVSLGTIVQTLCSAYGTLVFDDCCCTPTTTTGLPTRTGGCPYCTNGITPAYWTLNISGMGGACAEFNGTWNLTYVSGCLWSLSSGSLRFNLVLGSDGGLTLTLSDVSNPALVVTYDRATINNCCLPVTLLGSPGLCPDACLCAGTVALTPNCSAPLVPATGGSGDSQVHVTCCPLPMPAVLYAKITVTSGVCPPLNGATITLNWHGIGTDGRWEGSLTVSGCTISVIFYCDATTKGWVFVITGTLIMVGSGIPCTGGTALVCGPTTHVQFTGCNVNGFNCPGCDYHIGYKVDVVN